MNFVHISLWQEPMKKKRTITLEDGTIVDCGVEEFEDLKQAIKEENSRKIVLASVRVMMSSDKMMQELTDKIGDFLKTDDL